MSAHAGSDQETGASGSGGAHQARGADESGSVAAFGSTAEQGATQQPEASLPIVLPQTGAARSGKPADTEQEGGAGREQHRQPRARPGRHAAIEPDRGSAASEPARLMRHLTVTGFLVHDGRVLLHWHRRNQLWLPMGGHIEPDEDPIQAVLREVAEESGVRAALLPTTPPLTFDNLRQLSPPATILLAPVLSCGAAKRAGWDGPVEHIDLVYFCRPLTNLSGLRTDDPTMRWLDRAAISENAPLAPFPDATPAALPEDVRVLALAALDAGIGTS